MPSPTAPQSIRAATEGRRLEILELIWDGERTVSDIASHLPISVSAVSQHLSKLRDAGLVVSRAEGRRRYYAAHRDSLGAFEVAIESLWGDRSGAGEKAAPTAADSLDPTPRTTAVRAPTLPSRPVTEEMDEMASWYRQGLRARVVALEAARSTHATNVVEGTSAIRRLARSLTRPAIAERFTEIGTTAHEVAAQKDNEIVAGAGRLIGAIRQVIAQDDATTARILIVEDSRVEAMLHRSIISGPNRDIVTATTVAEAYAVLEVDPIDLILLDLTLPGGDGRDLLIGLSRRPGTTAIPVILLTGRTDVQTRTEAASLGADAFYTKPVEPAVLAAAVSMMLERSAEARQLGRRDPLTGLRNRSVFLDDVRQLAATALRANVALSLAIVDIDRLDAINDFHGSEVGDAVVRSMADNLKQSFRTSDMVARWGGSKFAVLFSSAEPTAAATALGKLEDRRVDLPDGSATITTWRAGIAAILDPTGVDDAVARATRRLQTARRSTSRIVSVDASTTAGVRTILLIEDDDILADLITHRLDREDFAVRRFSDGAEALASLATIDASAVILDTMLPGAEGFEVLSRLKQAASFAGVPVIVLTFGSEHDAKRAFQLGASDCLAKPFSVEELVARVSHLAADGEEGAR